MRNLTIFGLDNIAQVEPGDDVAELIVEKAQEGKLVLSNGDLVVISQKVVSKADALLVDVRRIKPSPRTKRLAKLTKKDPRALELILRDSSKGLRATSQALVVRRKDGLVCLNAGVDKSNVEGHMMYRRLPLNSDNSKKIRKAREAVGTKTRSYNCRHIAALFV